MNFFEKGEGRPLKLTVRRDRIRDIKRGYPWLYAHSLVELPKAPPGTFSVIRDSSGKILAKGFYDPSCPIVFRVCALEEELNQDLIAAKLQQAADVRRPILASGETSACRMINGEGDSLPGMVCDRFEDTLIMQFDGQGPERFWKAEPVADWMRSALGVKNVYLKPRSGSNQSGRVLAGREPRESCRFRENGVQFEADLMRGQKSGFFLDQRENRKKIAGYAAGKQVLNLFGYTGGFSVYCGLAGAGRVVTVDSAKPAIECARRNWQLNGLDETLHQGVAGDAFDYLEKAQDGGQRFQVTIVDPPSFAPSKAALERGRAAYVALFSQAAAVTSASGILAASSCSSHVSQELFVEICTEAVSKARRRGVVLGMYGQPPDHPFPLVCRELQYLKFLLIKLD